MRARVVRVSQAVIDLAVLAIAMSLSFFVRFDGLPPLDQVGRLLLTLPYVVVGEYAILWVFGVPRFSWRFIGLREALRIAVAVGCSFAALTGVRFALPLLSGSYPYLRHGVLPLGVLAINGVMVFLGILGVRVLRRWIGERVETPSNAPPSHAAVPTMLIGAGQAGWQVTRELNKPQQPFRPVGFLDDDFGKHGTMVNGVPVLGGIERLPELCARHGARQVLITIAAASGTTIRRITRLAEEAEIPVQIVPGLSEIVAGRVQVSRIRPIAIEDLLRRDPVELDDSQIAALLEGKRVLVTGAGGSIGSELCRQIARFGPSRLLLFERSENALFNIHREITASFPELEVVPLIGDVTDLARVEAAFERHQPSVVFHAAAHKHVPMMEWNPLEALKNNVGGTRVIASAADRHRATAFVLISTDKAVNPSSVMGATKRLAEMWTRALAKRSRTRFVAVRFGNVLGSAGSVVPIFKEQIAAGGPVKVTHPEMRRFFMTIPEACQLVLQAGAMGQGREIFVLDMGEPVRIVDLASDLIRLSGLRVGEDIEIEFTGVRPGEKLYEELGIDEGHTDRTRHPKVFVLTNEVEPDLVELERHWARFENEWARLESAAEHEVASELARLVPEFRRPRSEKAPAPVSGQQPDDPATGAAFARP